MAKSIQTEYEKLSQILADMEYTYDSRLIDHGLRVETWISEEPANETLYILFSGNDIKVLCEVKDMTKMIHERLARY